MPWNSSFLQTDDITWTRCVQAIGSVSLSEHEELSTFKSCDILISVVLLVMWFIKQHCTKAMNYEWRLHQDDGLTAQVYEKMTKTENYLAKTKDQTYFYIPPKSVNRESWISQNSHIFIIKIMRFTELRHIMVEAAKRLAGRISLAYRRRSLAADIEQAAWSCDLVSAERGCCMNRPNYGTSGRRCSGRRATDTHRALADGPPPSPGRLAASWPVTVNPLTSAETRRPTKTNPVYSAPTQQHLYRTCTEDL